MGFFNVQHGDAPYLKSARRHLHDERQLPSGGQWAAPAPITSCSATGDAIWFSDGNGKSATPPNNPVNPQQSRHARRPATSAR